LRLKAIHVICVIILEVKFLHVSSFLSFVFNGREDIVVEFFFFFANNSI